MIADARDVLDHGLGVIVDGEPIDVFGFAGTWASTGITPAILIDMPGGPYNDPVRAFIRDNLKLYVTKTSKELFDLEADPRELKNVFKKRSDEIEAHYAVAKKRLREIVVTGKRK